MKPKRVESSLRVPLSKQGKKYLIVNKPRMD
jgi:hypothetical protein